jgi:hypothetical protein
MKRDNENQKPGDNEPQAPRSIPVEKVDDGNRPLNNPKREPSKNIAGEPRKCD